MDSYLEVEVNGEEVFWVNKTIVSSFSCRLDKSVTKSLVEAEAKPAKVLLCGFPGGPEAFEMLLKFCYKSSKSEITPTNVCLLNLAAHFMEMTVAVKSSPSLVQETEKSLEMIPYWTWSESLVALRQCQDYCSSENTSAVFDKVVESIVVRIASTNETSPSTSSPESSGLRFSFDTRSTVSTKNSSHRSWWFDDLMVFNTETVQMLVKSMALQKLDHQTIARFLLYYLKNKTSNGRLQDKKQMLEFIIELLFSLDRNSVCCKSLFSILRMSLMLNVSESCRSKLDEMIGCQMDQATLDNILVPATAAMDSLYDVNLVLRLLKSFLKTGGRSSTTRLNIVATLVDLYLAEVAPDPSLKPQKFVSLAMILPDEARDSYDEVYRALDMYIQVHGGLSEEERMRICCVLNYEKLSSETCKHLTQNSNLPSRTAIQALVSQQSKLKSLLQETNNYKFIRNSPRPVKDLSDGDQVVLYAKKLDSNSIKNEKLKDHLQGMQWKVVELEKICRKMQTQMTRIMKPGMPTCRSSKSLPKLCS